MYLTFFGGLPITPSFSVQEANTGTGVSVPYGLHGHAGRYAAAGDRRQSEFSQQRRILQSGRPDIPQIYPTGNGTGPRNFITQPGTFGNDMTMSKKFTIVEGKTLEFRVSAYNAFNQVRRTTINSSVQYKAQGASYANGFAVYNTPDQLAGRVAAGTNPLTVFNQYRTGVGYDNLTNVLPMRIVEVGLKFRF